MGDISQSIKDLYKDYKGGLDKALYVLRDIPSGKLARAKKKYAPVSNSEVVLMLLDNTLTGATVLGSAKEGFVLTSRNLYYCDKDSGKQGAILVRDISAIKHTGGNAIDIVCGKDTIYFYPYGFNKETLAEFLSRSIALIKSN